MLPRGNGRGFMTPAKRPVLTFGSGMAHADASHVFEGILLFELGIYDI